MKVKVVHGSHNSLFCETVNWFRSAGLISGDLAFAEAHPTHPFQQAVGWLLVSVVPRWFGLTAGRTGPSVREPPNADRQPALMPVGLSATTLPYPIFLFPLQFQKR